MAFVKLDCGILNSTIWFDRTAREVFITSLLLAEPREFDEPIPQLTVRTMELTGWSAPAGWYGFVPAASVGIIRTAGVEMESGMAALEQMGQPESESRSQEYEGRRMIRCNGGFLLLNYDKYRERDYTTADRSRRYRVRQAAKRNAVTPRDSTPSRRDITQAEGEAEAVRSALPGSKTTLLSSLGKSEPKDRLINGELKSKIAPSCVADTWKKIGG